MANVTGKLSRLEKRSVRIFYQNEHVAPVRAPPVQATPRHDIYKYSRKSEIPTNIASEIIQRRTLLSLAATAATLGGDLLQPGQKAIAAPTTLSQSFESSEGFQFSYPAGWVVAYDRSGGRMLRRDGAVAAVGDFTKFLVVSVFRTVDIPKDINLDNGLTEFAGRSLCIDPLLKEDSTQSLNVLRSESSGEGRRRQYDFEYEIEVCRGEIQEQAGGVLRCLGGLGQEIPTQKRHHLARAVLSGGQLLTINAAAPLEKWAEVEDIMRAIVVSYRSV
jgi:hypothetical protein